MSNTDIIRELEKTLDVLRACDRHFTAEAEMNAALHMATTVRPAPLASAVSLHIVELEQSVERLRRNDND